MTATTVFVSGANGYIAQHIVKQLLEHGYNVVGSVRSASKGEELKQLTQSENFSYEVVADIGEIGAFDNALKRHPEVTVFLHAASPVTFSATDFDKEVIQPAINGTKNALAAIKEHAPQVQRVVVTSSIAAVIDFINPDPTTVYTEESWSPITHEQGLQNGLLAYVASKKFAELEVDKFMKQEKPKFKITTTQPGFVFGPQAYVINGNASADIINTVVNLGPSDKIPENSGTFIDVRDVAKAHLVAFEKDEAIDQRLVLVNEKFTFEGIAHIINENFPDSKVPRGDLTKDDLQKNSSHNYNTSKTNKILGFDFIPLQKSIVDTMVTSSVFISGANGYIAQHIVKQLLEHGHNVVGSVRSVIDGDELKQLIQSENFSYEIVADIGNVRAFDDAIKKHPEVTVFIHSASPVPFPANDVEKEIIQPAINGTRNALLAITEHAPQIKRVVVTSSVAAVVDLVNPDPETIYTEDSWSPITYEQGLQNEFHAYFVSKKFSELEVWKFVKENNPTFKVTTIQPGFVLGPAAYDSTKVSSEFVNAVVQLGPSDKIPESSGAFIDVRDVARAHLAALEKDEAIDQRLVLVNENFSFEGIAHIIKENFPNSKVPEGDLTKDELQKKSCQNYDTSKSNKILGFDFISLEKSVVDSVAQYYQSM
ncbi:putative NADPH-dependent methylglyoxal reductase GRP2 [Spathaspora sp. JA1]|nr:putative NADPH-dependent methylglyoxal reductase GRP2 [Spathaspora sp. JA1]